MQQDHIARAQFLQILDHSGKVHTAGFRVEIPIGDGFHTQVVQDRQMVGPCRIRHENARCRVAIADHLKGLSHRAGAARCCRRRHRARWHGIAQNQPGKRRAIGRIAQQTDIGFGLLLFPQPMLCGLDRAHDRGDTLRVLENADAEVDLAIARVILERLHQRQDLVCGLCLESVEHHASPVATGRVGKAPHSDHDPS